LNPKNLLVISSFIQGLSLLLFCYAIHTKSIFIIYFSCFLYIFVYGMGFCGSFWYYVTTVLPAEYVTFGGSIRFGFDFLSVFFGLEVMEKLGLIFWLSFAGMCFFIALFILFFAVNTKDKSSNEIIELFKKKTKNLFKIM